jgi:hypothetical protein
VPADWHVGANFVHTPWAPSRFTANAVADLIDGSVSVVRHPVANGLLASASHGRTEFGLPEQAVIVLASLNLASSFVRKNPLGIIKAFRMAFGTRSDRILVMKVVNPDHFPDDFAQLTTAVKEPTTFA